MASLETLTLADFATLAAPLLVPARDGPIPLRVKSTRALPPHALRATPPFSVIFEGPLDRVLRQGTFPIDHPALGRMELFLVPVARTATGIDYEAVFN
ncbi:MAG: hypothetical protein U1F41_09740 [Burkholderiales bacterium]